jgi:hypothetical protein
MYLFSLCYHDVYYNYIFKIIKLLYINVLDWFPGPSSSKRRKIDVGWNVLRDTLTNSQETPALLGWYV